MKANKYIKIFACMLCCMLAASCYVHQFPDPKVEFILYLDYETEMPLHKVVEYSTTKGTLTSQQEYDTRYLVKVYDAEDLKGEEELYSFVFTKEDVSELGQSLTLMLYKGHYRFVVWTDFVPHETQSDYHYMTDRYDYLTLPEGSRIGSNDMMDAFTGSVVSEVTDGLNQAEVIMTRPLAKFNFVSTDLSDFVSRVKGRNATNQNNRFNLEDYTVVFIYNGFVPSAYNLHERKPVDATSGVFFRSKIRQINDTEAEMGFDYLFVNGEESRISVKLEVYDVDGTRLSSFPPVEVPLMRSKLTTVKANFLTSEAGGGVTVLPDYDGEHNIVVD